MIKKTITWESLFDDEEDSSHKKDFYFHLTKDELISMELGGNLTDVFKRLKESEDAGEKWDYIKQLVSKSFGIRDGNDFDKSDDVARKKFMGSPAFDALIIELLSSEQAALEFIIGIFPRDLSRQISQRDIDQAIAEARAEFEAKGGSLEDVQLPQVDPTDKPSLEELGVDLNPQDALEVLRRKIHEQ
jgi:hypothetical protein